jgi:hypothetical protein
VIERLALMDEASVVPDRRRVDRMPSSFLFFYLFFLLSLAATAGRRGRSTGDDGAK